MKRSSRILLGILGFLVVAAASGGATYLLVRRPAVAPPPPVQTQQEKGVMVQAGDFLTNLGDPGFRVFIQIEVWLEVRDEKTSEAFTEHSSQFGHEMLRLLRSRLRADVEGAEGMERLRLDVLKIARSILGAENVLEVYFRKFIIQ